MAEREAAIASLKLLITQTVSNLRQQIRKGVYPKTVLSGLGIFLTRFRQPTTYEDIL